MKEEICVVDGCAFTEGNFIGLSQKVQNSSLMAFLLTLPAESEGYRECTNKIGAIYNLIDDLAEDLTIAKTVDDIKKARVQGKKAIVMTFQNPHPMENSLNKLRVFYELGLRVMQMTYNKSNYIGTGCVETFDRGLTDFGCEVLKKMNEWGIVADISHCGRQTGIDVLKRSKKPIVISHAGVFALTENPRNKSDDELRMLRDNGGVIGLSPWGPLCWKRQDRRQPRLSDFVDHIDYVKNLIGIDHVGFGGDSTLDDTKDEKGTVEQATLYAPVVAEYNKYVGTDPTQRHAIGVSGSWEIENVFGEMRKRGYSDSDIAKFAGGNFMRVFEENWG